ncbi:MAG: amidohydrolase [Clostridiales Family XIII bacterium]|nr:amidohydrolase [Clostridiales Family XIII bacterium]
MNCDLLIENTDIVTMNPAMPTAKWIAVNDGKIAAVGAGDDRPDDVGERRSFPGSSVLPGFIDSHVHGSLTGNSLLSADIGEATDVEEIVNIIGEHCRNANRRIVSATKYSAIQMKDRPLNAADLDRASKDHIIVVYDRSCHGCVLNSAAMREANLPPEMWLAQGDVGEGVITDDTAYLTAINNIMMGVDEETVKSYMLAVNELAVGNGVTCIHSLDGSDYIYDAQHWVKNRTMTDIHIVNYWETLDFEKLKPFDLPRIGGCICLDGSRVMHTMAVSTPYLDDPGNLGVLYYTDDEVYKFVSTAHENDMQCAMHAMGDRAIAQLIGAIERVTKEQGHKNLRHRIEHFSMPTDRQIELAVELNLTLAMQPAFTLEWDRGENSVYKQRFGKDGASRNEPFARIIRAGGIICGGSDSPVTPLEPLSGIGACVDNPDPSRNISLTDALKMFTINGAWAAHEENDRGSIEVGKAADFVVLDHTWQDMTKSVGDLGVKETIIAGKTVFSR